MKSFKTFTSAVLLTVFVTGLFTACTSREIGKIEQVTGDFFTAVIEGDFEETSEFTEDSRSISEAFENLDDDEYEVLQAMLGESEYSIEDVTCDRRAGTAVVEIEFTYPDVAEITDSEDVTHEELLSLIAEGEELETEDVKLKFAKDEDGRWYIKDRTVVRFGEFLAEEVSSARTIFITADRAQQVISSFIEGAAEYGLEAIQDLTDGCFTFDDFRVYELISGFEINNEAKEAINNFIKAYYSFIFVNGVQFDIDTDSLYSDGFVTGNLTLQVPSSEELYQVLKSEEVLVPYIGELLVDGVFANSSDATSANQMLATIYNELADAVSGVSAEEYDMGTVALDFQGDSADSEEGVIIRISSPLIVNNSGIIYDAEHSLTAETLREYREAAIDMMQELGRITAAQAEYLRDMLFSEDEDGSDTSTEEILNQAVDLEEYVPSWSDGSIAYGQSRADDNGVRMYYSKEPGVLDTAAYYIDEKGITITSIFDEYFPEGTVLYIDWWVGSEDELYSSEEYIVPEGGTKIITAHVDLDLEDGLEDGTYSLRIWREDHSYVISYVKLIKEG